MRNENRAVFDRGPEPIDYAFDLPTEEARETGDAVLSAPRRNLLARVARWLAARLRQRSNTLALLELNDEQLKDIGVSRCQAYGEYSRYRQSNSHDLERRFR